VYANAIDITPPLSESRVRRVGPVHTGQRDIAAADLLAEGWGPLLRSVGWALVNHNSRDGGPDRQDELARSRHVSSQALARLIRSCVIRMSRVTLSTAYVRLGIIHDILPRYPVHKIPRGLEDLPLVGLGIIESLRGDCDLMGQRCVCASAAPRPSEAVPPRGPQGASPVHPGARARLRGETLGLVMMQAATFSRLTWRPSFRQLADVDLCSSQAPLSPTLRSNSGSVETSAESTLFPPGSAEEPVPQVNMKRKDITFY
jgi:hypothetical protein